jgi:hypothetical protein
MWNFSFGARAVGAVALAALALRLQLRFRKNDAAAASQSTEENHTGPLETATGMSYPVSVPEPFL